MARPAVKNPNAIRTALDRLLFRLMSRAVKSAIELHHDSFDEEIKYLQEESEHPKAQVWAADTEHLSRVSWGCWS